MNELAVSSVPVSQRIVERFESVRSMTRKICSPLCDEDCVVQSMPDASPIRWHLAHTTWFFETFVLAQDTAYRPFHEKFLYLFNSYYNSVGEQFARPNRGILSRPTVSEIWEYREYVDERILELLTGNPESELLTRIELGLHHEQQHQELMLTDLKHAFSMNPLFPVYDDSPVEDSVAIDQDWLRFDEQITEIGFRGDGFCFDNELPSHRVLLNEFAIATRSVTSEEFLNFMQDDGYARPELWLSLGWSTAQERDWKSPLYWHDLDGTWHEFTLHGLRPIDPLAPVTHVSYFEADAFARWAGQRLLTEFEWELASEQNQIDGHFVEDAVFHPRMSYDDSTNLGRMFGDIWEWTSSQYSPYPGFQAAKGALGEYNGKFMCNQFVLRGGSCATSRSHIRKTYRNFFPPDARWQFSGIRLASS